MASRYSERYQAMLARLRTARREAGLNQVDVARVLGKHQSFVSKLETGERRIDPIELQDLAEMYGKPVSYFLSGDARG